MQAMPSACPVVRDVGGYSKAASVLSSYSDCPDAAEGGVRAIGEGIILGQSFKAANVILHR